MAINIVFFDILIYSSLIFELSVGEVSPANCSKTD